jgi:hypothetical protein
MAIAQELLECLQAALATRPEPLPDERVCLRAGESVAPSLSTNADECCPGLAWVRVAGVEPAEGFVIANPRCVNHVRTVTLEMGVVRCMPTPGPNNMVTCDQWTAKTLQLDSDYEAMEAALCCLSTQIQALPGDVDVVPGPYAPLGPDGNCIGGTLTLQTVFACACGSG